ncbi:hypothetical protein [Chryseobacterium sp. GP-SGM7]|uniref:hypothetical protein n=1 Tax=Chryseobacterium sp. GP-SGM7 TaxID=3411323 RepID=UPI003B92C738
MEKSEKIISYFSSFIKDSQMQPVHISLYVALFELWSINKFQSPFRICRKEVMRLSKIKSFATYHKCIKEMHNAGFIIYSPTYNSYKGSSIEIVDFETLDLKGRERKRMSKDEGNSFYIPQHYEVELYFDEMNMLSEDAKRFYSTYQSKDWKLCNEEPMKCWRSAARIWISKIKNNIQTKTYEGNKS